eukprot:2081209-Lingulodinium_polyedra.AAC.1
MACVEQGHPGNASADRECWHLEHRSANHADLPAGRPRCIELHRDRCPRHLARALGSFTA